MTTAQDSGNHDTLITGDELARMPDHEDPTARTVSVHRPNGTVTQHAESDAVPCDDALPGFKLPVDEVM